LKSRNLPTNPISGGIPDIDKIVKTIVSDVKLYLLKTFKLFSVFIFFISYKNSKLKKRYNKKTYINIFRYIIEIP